MTDMKCTAAHNPAAFVKASKRYKQIMKDYAERDGPVAIKAWKILPSPLNRLGAPLNIQYIHCELGQNVLSDVGFDPKRPNPGVVVRRTNPDKIKKLQQHAMMMNANSPRLFPPVHAESPECVYECISANHLTCLLRMFEAKMTSELTKQTFVVPKDDSDLANVVESGHLYHVLRDDIPDVDMEFLSEYLNSDQNQNQCTSEISTLAQVDKIIKKELETTPHPKVSSVVRSVMQESMLKLRADSIGDMAHYCINMAGTNYISQLVFWHSRYVNPREMSVSPRWLGDVARIMGKQFPNIVLGMTLLQYRGEMKLPQTRPNPDISRSIGAAELNSLVKDASVTNVEKTEEFLRDTINLLSSEFVTRLGSTEAVGFMFTMLQEVSARLLLSKDLNAGFDHSVSGKFDITKLISLRASWMQHLENNVDKKLKGVGAQFDIMPDTEHMPDPASDEVMYFFYMFDLFEIDPHLYEGIFLCVFYIDLNISSIICRCAVMLVAGTCCW